MREIKFDFVYGVDGEVETYHRKSFSFVEIENGDHIDWISDSPLIRDHSILAKRQFTGIKDKNGVEIYEGDIIEIKGKKEYPKEICFDSGAFLVKVKYGLMHPLYDLHAHDRTIQVLGNIYENPELLTQPDR